MRWIKITLKYVCVYIRDMYLTERVKAFLWTDVTHHDNTENFPIKVLFECVYHMGLLKPNSTVFMRTAQCGNVIYSKVL